MRLPMVRGRMHLPLLGCEPLGCTQTSRRGKATPPSAVSISPIQLLPTASDCISSCATTQLWHSFLPPWHNKPKRSLTRVIRLSF